jgi:hypothetical protein
MPPPPKLAGAGDQYPQHRVATLAGLAEAGKPMPGPGVQLSKYAPEANPATGKKDVVWFALNEDLCVPKIRFGVDAASGRRKLAS